MRRAGLCLASTAAAISLIACTPSVPRGSLLPGAPEVPVAMREFRFDYPAEIQAGRAVFRVANEGRLDHRLSMMPWPDDYPNIDEQLKGTERRVVSPFAGVPTVPPGGKAVFSVELAPGTRYAFVCFVVDADGQSHALRGMSAQFRVAGIAPPTTVARPTTTVSG